MADKDAAWGDAPPVQKRPRGRPPGKMTTAVEQVYENLGPAEKKVFDHLAAPFQTYYINLAITNEQFANGFRRAPSHARAGFVALRTWLSTPRRNGDMRIDTSRVSAPHLHAFIRDRALEQAAQERPHEILSAANADAFSTIDSVAALSERALEVAKAKVGKGVGNGTLCRWARPSPTTSSSPYALAHRMLASLPAIDDTDADVALPLLLGREST